MSRPVRARIDAAALRHNLQQVRRHAPGTRVLAIIKADAYGHGLLESATALAAADGFGVESLDVAAELRAAGIELPIVLLEGVFGADEYSGAGRHAAECVVHCETQLRQLEQARLSAPIRVWLKIDTGMHRLGFAVEQVPAVHARLRRCAGVAQPIGLMTHLSDADEREHLKTRHQVEQMLKAIDGLDGPISIANSAGIIGWPETRRDWVRPGIMLYGVSPFVTGHGGELDLRPVMTLETRLIAVHPLQAGDMVGYGSAGICPVDMPVGVAAVGYGDGYPRHAPGGTPVLVNGQRAPLIGRVSMDMVSVDLRHLPGAKVGDPVVLWGDGLPIEEIAARSGTIAYELLCHVAARVPRVPH